MIILDSKIGCSYCDVLKQYLDEAGIEYKEKLIKKGVAPVLYKNKKVVFKGLPNIGDLLKFIAENKK